VRVLFDQGVPAPLGLKIAILVLPTTSWPRLQGRVREIVAAVDSLTPARYLELPLK